MKLRKVKGTKPLDEIINHLLERIDVLEQNQVELTKQLGSMDNEIAVLTEAVFESGPAGDYDA